VKDSLVPENLNWVKVRAACSIGAMFKALELGAHEDVAEVTLLIKPQDNIAFSVVANHRRFSVIREDGATAGTPVPVTREVNFVLEGKAIVISDGNGRLQLKATITLNNEGQCKLVVENNEVEQWQVRRMALEKLFFGPFA
jgi:hypothetical protein